MWKNDEVVINITLVENEDVFMNGLFQAADRKWNQAKIKVSVFAVSL